MSQNNKDFNQTFIFQSPPTYTNPGDFKMTRDLEDNHRNSGRTYQMVVNAIERAIKDGQPSYIIVGTYAMADNVKHMIRRIAGVYWHPELVYVLSVNNQTLLSHRIHPSQIFRDHAAF